MFLCSICFVVSCHHKCTSQSSLTETIRKESLSRVPDVCLSYRKKLSSVGPLHLHAYFDLLSTHNADHYFISIQIMALTILPISIIDWSDGQCIADRNNLLFVSYSGNLSISEFVWFPCSFSYSWTNTHRRAYKKQIPCFPSDLMACHTRSFCLWLQQKFVHINLDILLKKLSIVSVNLCLSQNASSAQKQQLTEGKNHDHITICDSRNPVR